LLIQIAGLVFYEQEINMAQKGSILIVDDEVGPRESLRMILKPIYEIYTATNGDEALQVIQDENIDLVTLDLRMPGLSGIDVLREIKKVRADVEVIVITGYGTLTNAQEAIRYGAGDFISKPFNVADIIAIISKSFERRNYNIKIKSLIQQIKDLRSAGPMKEECQSQVTH
jgi:DNA-binding NtrC family response regulator